MRLSELSESFTFPGYYKFQENSRGLTDNLELSGFSAGLIIPVELSLLLTRSF
jgi:hypothetical protein